MKKQSLKMLSVFIIVMMILSIIPEMVDAQKKCPKGHCPKGFSCVDGYCLPSGHGGGGGGGGCNCNVRPVPFSCGQICGFLAGQTPEINLLSISSNNSFEISFELIEAQNVSLKIFDATGKLIKTLADNRMPEGDHQIEWNKKDEGANVVSPGIYILQFDAGTHSGTKKLTVI